MSRKRSTAFALEAAVTGALVAAATVAALGGVWAPVAGWLRALGP